MKKSADYGPQVIKDTNGSLDHYRFLQNGRLDTSHNMVSNMTDSSHSNTTSPANSTHHNGQLSPLSVNGQGQDYFMGPAAKKAKKGSGIAGRSIEEELCLICGDRASGYHYNALSCEGCKGFFRRSVTRNASYSCKYGGNCEMDMWMRRKCQSCRLRRCREVGMKEECLLSDEQCKARDARRKSKAPVSRTQSQVTQLSPDSNNDSRTNPQVLPTKQTVTQGDKDPLIVLSSEQKDLIEKIVTYQDQYELASEDDLQKTSQFTANCKDFSEAVFIQMAEMTILTTQLIVEFAKHLPGFMSLDKEDQIILLKGSACEVMVLRTARRYDLNTDTVVFGDGQPYTRNNLRFAGLQNFVDSMYDFCRGMGMLQVDNAEYALITAICIFSERPGLSDRKKVESLQEVYVNTLQNYVSAKRKKGSNFFAKLIMKLTELRSLSAEHSEVLLALKVQKGSLPPLLMEYFDISNS